MELVSENKSKEYRCSGLQFCWSMCGDSLAFDPPRGVTAAGEIVDDVDERVGVFAYLLALQFDASTFYDKRIHTIEFVVDSESNTIAPVFAQQFAGI